MGFLLLQYEYQRASREVSIHQRAGMRLDNQVDRYTKRIENMQSVFQKAQDRLTKNFTNLSNDASAVISQATNAAASAANVAAFNSTLMGIVIGGVRLGQFVQASCASTDPKEILTVLSNVGAQAKSILASLIEDAKEADLMRLQNQQDAQLDPIAEKESDLQAKQNLENTLCDVWTTRRDNAKQRLGQDIKESMASYGLNG
jgi:phosphotransferase system HPr-like phosphotransfer protein